MWSDDRYDNQSTWLPFVGGHRLKNANVILNNINTIIHVGGVSHTNNRDREKLCRKNRKKP